MEAVKLNLIPGSVLPVVNVSQFDEGRAFTLTIYDGSTAANLTGASVSISGRKNDGNAFSYDETDTVMGEYVVSVSSNVVTIHTTKQMTAVEGRNLTTLQITKTNSDVSTLNFILQVQEHPLNDADVSDTEIPAIIDLATEQMERAETAADTAEDCVETIQELLGVPSFTVDFTTGELMYTYESRYNFSIDTTTGNLMWEEVA